MSNREWIVRVEDASFGYHPSRPVLEGVNLAVRRGEFWFFAGPNGQGKSTLIHSLLGWLPPRRGSVRWNRELVSAAQVGFIPQRCDFNPTFPVTVREFVELGCVGLRYGRAERASLLAWSLERLGLADRARADYWSLSGGQRQRVLVARTLVRRPTVLLVDEPTNGLDLAASSLLLESLDRLNREERLTVVFVTHDLPLAARYATHVALFHGGRVRAGSREEVLIPENLSRAYEVPISVMQGADGVVAVGVARGEAQP